MHDCVIRQHRDDAATQSLVAHATHALVANDNPAVAPTLAARHAIAQKQQCLAGDKLCLAQTCDYAALIDGAVGSAHAAAEVTLEVGDWERVRY